MPSGWAFVGLGHHAESRVAPAISQAADTRLVAVCSRDREKAARFAQAHGAERSYSSYEALLRDPEVQVVYLATPNSLHAPQTIAAAEAGKHVLCEKPMALSVAEAEAMVEACRRNGVKLGVGFHLRHHPAHIEARRLVASGVVGEVVLAQAQFAWGAPARTGWWRDPQMVGGAYSLMTHGVHAIDLLRYLLGQEIVEVAAFTDGQTPERPLDMLTLGLMRFQGGAFGYFACGRRVPHSLNSVIVYGSKCRLIGDNTLSTVPEGQLLVTGDTFSARWEFNPRDLYTAEIEAFNQSIRENREPNASGTDGLRVVEATVAIVESRRRGQAVRIGHE